MTDKKYEIFISYRRDGGAQYARILQLMLIQRGYRVFLDYDELRDGIFNKKIVKAIKEAPIFIFVLSKGALLRCINKDDSVRNEIELAVTENKKIIPIDPDKSFDGIPDGLPPKVAYAMRENQHSDIDFGQTLGVTVDYMIGNRIAKAIGPRKRTDNVDEDYINASATLKKKERHQKFMRHAVIFGITAILAVVLVIGILILKSQEHHYDSLEARTELERKYEQYLLHLVPTINQSQMKAIDAILDQMIEVREDTLWMSQYEFNRGWWHDIMDLDCPEEERTLPMTNVSYGDICLFINVLYSLTKIDFSLPSAEEWEYAARGGEHFEFAGSGNADSVAWYMDNSEGRVHPSDGLQDKACNRFDLFDMSGNVGELCKSPYGARKDGGQWAVCGGNYLSDIEEVRVTSQTGITAEAKSPTVGFRLAIRKKDKTL